MEYQNSGYAKIFILHFSLENPISNSDYFKIVFPIDLGLSPKASLYEDTKLLKANKSSVPVTEPLNYFWLMETELKANT